MYQSTILLNYLAFFTLFITGFVFIFQKNASLLGYVVVFITNTVFMVYMTGLIVPEISNKNYFVAIASRAAVMITTIFHFVSLIFILMMIYQLHVKYSAAEGLPINIPDPYKSQLYQFNVLMITSFCLCTLLLVIIFFRSHKLDVNLYELMTRMNLYLFARNLVLLFALSLSIATVVISSLQVQTANGFAKLSRQQLNLSEYKNKGKKTDLSSLGQSSQVMAIENTLLKAL
jgi:hypothetical protein